MHKINLLLIFIVLINIVSFNIFAASILDDDFESVCSLPKLNEDVESILIAPNSKEMFDGDESNDSGIDTESSSDDSDIEIVINHRKRKSKALAATYDDSIESDDSYADGSQSTTDNEAIEDTYDYCPFCPKKPNFTMLKQLFIHLKEVHDGKCPIINCKSKRYTGTSYLNFLKHKQIHLKAHKCEICAMEFRSRNALVDHIRMHNGTNKCGICDTFIKTNSTKIDHYQVMHLDGYKCPECLIKFNYRANFKTHLIKQHKYNEEQATEYVIRLIGKAKDLIKKHSSKQQKQ